MAPRPATDRYAHVGVHPQRQAGLNWIGVVMAVGRMTATRRAVSLPWPAIAGWRRAPHRLAEPHPVRRARRAPRRGGSPHRGAWLLHPADADPGRSRRLHRQCRLQVRGLQHQEARAGDRRPCRGARRHRRAGEHPPHGMPPFLRPALYRRYRPYRRAGAGERGRRHGRGLRHGRRRGFAEQARMAGRCGRR